MTHISFYGKGIPIHNEDKEVTFKARELNSFNLWIRLVKSFLKLVDVHNSALMLQQSSWCFEICSQP